MNKDHTTKHPRRQKGHDQGGDDEGVLHRQEVMRASGSRGK